MNPLQTAILSIFKVIKDICDRYNIPYYAIGGTCIGAVRHKGFIPWDDDLDIAIPIERIDEFIEIASKELPSYLYIYSPQNIKHFHFYWYKICDKRTAFIEDEDKDYPDAYKGVFVDIMPLSGIPEKKLIRKIFVWKLRWYGLLNQHTRFPDFMPTWSSKIMGFVLRTLVHRVPFDTYTKKYFSMLSKHPFNQSSLTGYVWDPGQIERLSFPKDWFEKRLEMDFEDTTISCPGEYDKYLTAQFGNYMLPPSVDRQETHKGLVDLEHSYLEYTNK